jgi:predicted RNase H-like HicB family nuclease
MKSMKNKIEMIVEKTETGFSAFTSDYPIFTTGKTVPELIKNAYEAVTLYFEDQEVIISPDRIHFTIDFKQFFQYFRVINSRFLAEKIGMNPTLLSQYIQGHKKPSDQQANKILSGIHEIGRELTELNLINRF